MKSISLVYSCIFLWTQFAVAEVDEDFDLAEAVDSEIVRLSGFKQHKQDEKNFDEEREKGRTADDEQREQHRLRYQKDLEEHRKTKKSEIEPERTTEYKEHVAEKKRKYIQHEDIETKYAKKTNAIRNKLTHRILSEEEELDLIAKSERIDYKKRVLYGAKPNFKALGKDSSGSGYSVPSSPSSGFPPPPDFSDTGFIPPPPMPDPFDPSNDYPPPPPPPDFSDGEFPPPPPPPDFGDF